MKYPNKNTTKDMRILSGENLSYYSAGLYVFSSSENIDFGNHVNLIVRGN